VTKPRQSSEPKAGTRHEVEVPHDVAYPVYPERPYEEARRKDVEEE